MNIMLAAADVKGRDVRTALELATKAVDMFELGPDERLSDRKDQP